MVGLIMFIASILFGLFGFGIAEYKATDPRDFIDEYKERDCTELIHFYGGDLKNAILENRKTNDGKVKYIRTALFSMTCGAITIIVYALIMLCALR